MLINLTTKSNLLEIYTYFLIRSQIKDNSLTASISELELSKLVGVSISTIKRYINNLKPFFTKISKAKTTGEHYYNHFTYLSDDYSIVSLINNEELTPKQKGLLIKIKLLCIAGTNFIKFTSKSELLKLIGIGKNSKMINELVDKGYLSLLENSLQLTQLYFPLYFKENIINYNYKVIYNYCLLNGKCPPLRDNKALSYIAAKYPNVDDSLLNDITKRLSKLPNTSLDYFVRTLNNKSIKRNKTYYGFII